MSYVDAHMTPEQEARFWSHVDKSGGCWLWTGACKPHGYGQFTARGTGRPKVRLAHRTAWELVHGRIPPGLGVCHNCPGGDNPACCNPAHLFLGTQKDNLVDCKRKGRTSRGALRPNAVLSAEIVAKARTQYARGTTSYRLLALEYGIAADTIRSAIHGKSWAHITDPPALPTRIQQVAA